MRPIKQLKRNIVIVCEGSETENHYFTDIVKDISTQIIWAKIEIIPAPIETTSTVSNIRTSPRSKRNLRTTNYYYITQEDSFENYEKYKTQPTRYVREAQLLKESGAYTDAWAVFDQDQHTDHEQAFKLANSVGVNIAFSSIAFEEWILLHFEKNINAFDKAECKKDGKSIGCGGEIQCLNDKKCLCGYLRTRIPTITYKKDIPSLFNILKPYLNQAYENSAWLRSKNNRSDLYNVNPYTDVDILVKTLLNDTIKISWAKLNDNISFCQDNFSITFSDQIIKITNTGNRTLLLNKDKIFLSQEYNINPSMLFFINKFIEPQKSIELTKNSDNQYLNFLSGNERLIIQL